MGRGAESGLVYFKATFFGVPFPVWYPLNGEGEPNFDQAIFATSDQLPVDPLSDCPVGYTEDQRNQPNGFMGDPDVMDTWATSSLTPQLISHWKQDNKRHQSIFPMDIRPQSHEIIRTWAFYTIVKAYIHDKTIPWKNVVISGWILDPDRKKMSKSKGNVVTPDHLLDQYSADAIRYWACKARLGADTAFDESMFSIGQKLITKCFNAAKFVLMQTKNESNLNESFIIQPVDMSWIQTVNQSIVKATKAYQDFDYASALDVTEQLFWEFCDHYIELVKGRAYREENQEKRLSACATLEVTLSVLCRLFAPVLPYISEEIWSWKFGGKTESIHQATWPGLITCVGNETQSSCFQAAKQIMTDVRATKTQAQKSMKYPVEKIEVMASVDLIDSCKLATDDIIRAGTIEECFFVESKQSKIVTRVILAVE